MSPSSVRISALDDIGNRDAPRGSLPWAKWFTFQAKKCRKDLETEASELDKLLTKLKEGEAWKPLGLASFSMLCSREIGLSMDEVDAIREAKKGQLVGAVLGKHGGDRKSEERDQVDNIKLIPSADGGTRSAYLTARLRRDRPDLVARLDAGEFPSVRAAAIEAGIVAPSFQCPCDPVKAARRILGHFNGERLSTLLAELRKQGS